MARFIRTASIFVALAALPGADLLAQEGAFRLEGMVITASPTPREEGAIANNVSILDGAELRARGLSTVESALRGVAGVDVVRNGSFGATTSVFMRGGESDYVLVLVDGVQMNQPGGGFDFASLSLQNVARIEVVRGPSSALHGSDAVAGVVHIITKSGAGPVRGAVSTRLGSYGRSDWSADIAGGTDFAGYSLSLSRSETDGVLEFNNQHSNTVLSGRASVAPGGRTNADISFRVGDRTYHFPTDGSGNVVDRNAFTFGDEAMLSLGLRNAVTEKISVTARIGVVDSDAGSNDAPDDAADSLGFFGFTSLDHVRRATADVRAHWFGSVATATAGWEFEEERARSFTESLSQYGSSSGRSENGRLNRAYYAHVTGQQGALAFNAGGRLEDNDRFGSFATWQLGATWALPVASDVRLRASAGSSLKEPTFFETFATGFATGNPELDPEKAVSWEIGSEAAFRDGAVSIRTTWFDQRFEDLIQYTFSSPTPGGANYFNVAEATSRGLEVEAQGAARGFAGRVSWTWLDTNVSDAGFDQGASAAFVEGERLLRRPSNTIRANLSAAASERLRVFGDVAVVGERSDRDFSTFPASAVQLPRHTDVTLGVSGVVIGPGERSTGLELTLRVENLLDREIQEVFGFRGAGRGIYLGGSVIFGGGG